MKEAPKQFNRFESKDSIKQVKQDAPPLLKSSVTSQSEVGKLVMRANQRSLKQDLNGKGEKSKLIEEIKDPEIANLEHCP